MFTVNMLTDISETVPKRDACCVLRKTFDTAKSYLVSLSQCHKLK